MAIAKTVDDGPYVIEGDVEIQDGVGKRCDTGARKPIALCRCGHSANKPFCDGARLDAATFVGEEPCPFPAGDPHCPRNDYRPGSAKLPERLFLEIDGGALRGRAGDTYVAFGRGILLSLRKIEALSRPSSRKRAREVPGGRRGEGDVPGVQGVL